MNYDYLGDRDNKMTNNTHFYYKIVLTQLLFLCYMSIQELYTLNTEYISNTEYTLNSEYTSNTEYKIIDYNKY